METSSSRRVLTIVFVGLGVACSRQASISTDADEQTSSTTESGSETSSDSSADTDEPPVSCASELDCGPGERCVEGSCSCTGCGCHWAAPSPSPAVQGPDPDPVFLDLWPGECSSDDQCEALEYCNGFECIPSSACTEDSECQLEWDDDRFCVDGLCRPIDECSDDAECPAGSICEPRRCRWIEILPSCAAAPGFEFVEAAPVDFPAEASLLVLDLDADQLDDLLVLDGGEIDLYRGQPGSLGLAAPTPWLVEPGAQVLALARGDVDGDGIDELLISHASPVGVEVVVAGQPPEPLPSIETTHPPEQVVTIDADFDGLPDLISYSKVEDDVPWSDYRVEGLLGDGQGVFTPAWLEEHGEYFMLGHYPAFDESDQCERLVAALLPSSVGAMQFNGKGVEDGHYLLIDRPVADFAFIGETATVEQGHVATASAGPRGLLVHHHVDFGIQEPRPIEIDPAPGAVAFLRASVDDSRSYALIDYGPAPSGFVEFLGPSLTPSCRGSLELGFDALDMQAGDFNGDGREELVSLSTDGAIRVWFVTP